MLFETVHLLYCCSYHRCTVSTAVALLLLLLLPLLVVRCLQCRLDAKMPGTVLLRDKDGYVYFITFNNVQQVNRCHLARPGVSVWLALYCEVCMQCMFSELSGTRRRTLHALIIPNFAPLSCSSSRHAD